MLLRPSPSRFPPVTASRRLICALALRLRSKSPKLNELPKQLTKLTICSRENAIFGLCTLSVGLGGAVAGLVQPYLGAAFALGAFGCMATA